MRYARNTIVLTAVAVLSLAVVALAGPEITIPEPTFDFGHVVQHAKVSHRFIIKSTGDDTLQITKIDPGCGCTQAPLADSVLAPGESTYLDLFFSTKSYRGKVDKKPYFLTNINKEKVYLGISGTLRPKDEPGHPIHIDPPIMDVSQFTPKPRRQASVWIHNLEKREYQLGLVDYADHVFEIKFPESIPANDSARVRIRIHESMVDQEFEHSITFSIDDPSDTRFTIPIKRMLRIKDRSGS